MTDLTSWETFINSIDDERNTKGACIHMTVRPYHVTRHVPGTVTVCQGCGKPVKFTPDITRERVVVKERVEREYIDRPVELGAAEWGLVVFIGVIAFCVGMIVGAGLF